MRLRVTHVTYYDLPDGQEEFARQLCEQMKSTDAEERDAAESIMSGGLSDLSDLGVEEAETTYEVVK